MTERTRIQKEILTLAKAGEFYEVTYDNDQLPNDVNIEEDDVVKPSSVKCNEVESQFAEDKKLGLDRKLVRISWVFDLLVEWDNQEVTLEYFERSLESMPIIPKVGDLRQVTLVLLSTVVEHPVLQQKSTGTQAKLTLRAELGRN